ncbi:MAG: polyprenol monophosphomannose synthase [Luteibaculaceae bacterium]
MKNLVIIPTYNEADNIQLIIEAVLKLPSNFHILVVDDSSPDGTAGLVKAIMQGAQEHVFLLERKNKTGLGTAYIAGFKWAIEHKYDLIYEMDADFSHKPRDLERLKKAIEEQEADLSIGSRYVKGGGVSDWPYSRILLSYFASVYVRLVLGIKVMDTTAGFVCYKRKVLEDTDFTAINSVGYGFQVEMKYQAIRNGYNLVEIPIIFKDRQRGKSKMHKGIIKEAFISVLQMRRKKYRKKLADSKTK